MNSIEIIGKINNGGFDGYFKKLYNNVNDARRRYISAVEEYVNKYGDADNLRLFSAPGRTEIGGNHTDHQHGCVLAGSVDLDVIAVVSRNDTGIIKVQSLGFDEDCIVADDLEKNEYEIGHAPALIRGVSAAFIKNGHKSGGFNAYTTSKVMKGSGLSSSAAFEVLIATIINVLYNDEKISPVDIAKYSQFAEREYFGKPCGLLDQMACASGGFTYADFNEPTNPIVENISVDIGEFGYTLCVVDTKGDHTDLTQDYADITLEMRSISNQLGVNFLRDADAEKFYNELPRLKGVCTDRAILRAFHFFNEQERVLLQKKAIIDGDFEDFLRLVNESGESSYKYLQNLYSTSAPKIQGLSLAIALTKKFIGNSGACRVHGGGFAGTIQCYIPTEKFAEYKAMIDSIYGDGSCIELFIRPVGGVEIL